MPVLEVDTSQQALKAVRLADVLLEGHGLVMQELLGIRRSFRPEAADRLARTYGLWNLKAIERSVDRLPSAIATPLVSPSTTRTTCNLY